MTGKRTAQALSVVAKVESGSAGIFIQRHHPRSFQESAGGASGMSRSALQQYYDRAETHSTGWHGVSPQRISTDAGHGQARLGMTRLGRTRTTRHDYIGTARHG